MLSSHLPRCLTWAATALLALSCSAQVMRDPGTMPNGRRVHDPATAQGKHKTDAEQGKPSAAKAAAPQAQIKIGASTAATAPSQPAAPPQPTVPPSLLDKPPQPATVKLSDGQLSVDANNSSLSQILDHLKSSTGMTVDGLSHDQRVFGVYGPGSPADVLSSLLDDAGYNVMMLGTTRKGAPREIILTARSNAPTPPVQASPSDQQTAPDDNGDDDNPQPPSNYPFPQQHYPEPVQTPPPQNGTVVKTPAQILQELQQLRQQQQQQQQAPPQ